MHAQSLCTKGPIRLSVQSGANSKRRGQSIGPCFDVRSKGLHFFYDFVICILTYSGHGIVFLLGIFWKTRSLQRDVYWILVRVSIVKSSQSVTVSTHLYQSEIADHTPMPKWMCFRFFPMAMETLRKRNHNDAALPWEEWSMVYNCPHHSASRAKCGQ